MALQMAKNFFKLEAAAGILLGFTALMAMALQNSPLSFLYDAFLTTPLAIQIGAFSIHKPLLLWINDGLMAVFFCLVGLEIKREVLEGELSNRKQVLLPAFAALGGIVVPALIYLGLNQDNPQALKGWAIPAATDIAFALGILALLGKRAHENLKITLLAIAIMDDLAAIVIIALFYTEHLSFLSIALACMAIFILFMLNLKGVQRHTPYIITGIFLWACVLKSGIHATLAGVIVAFFIPLNGKSESSPSPLRVMEHELHPWVAFGVLPLFAFANAGVSLKGLSLDMLMQPITLGVAAGLFIGKQLGVMLMTILMILLGLAQLPNQISWKQYYGMACLTGIGFTMSLFIGALAFDAITDQSAVRLGVLSGSLLSGTLGYLILRMSPKKENT